MKKFFTASFIIFIVPFIFPLLANASSNYDVFRQDFFSASNYDIGDNNALKTYWENNPNKKMACGTRNGGYSYVAVFGDDLQITNNHFTNYQRTPVFGIYPESSAIYEWTNSDQNDSISTFIGSSPYIYDGFNGIDYTWTNVSYDSSVPTPSLDVDLSKNVNEKYFNTPDTPMYGQLGPEIPYYLGIKGSSVYEDYYIYIDMTIWTPTSGELKLENGIYSFTPQNMIKTDDIAYFKWEDLQPAPTTNNLYYQTNAPLTGSTILLTQQDNLNTWYNIRRYIEDGTSDYPEMNYTTTLTGTAKDNGISRINQLLRNASLAGNRVRFRTCLYYINENNEIKCGNFATWTSAQPSSPTSEQPSTNAQVIDQPASGISQTVSYDNIVSENESTNNIPPVNVTTGGANINVTVNTGEQNVPNNQNYPTVVSYNHDNIFTTFIGTYNSASQYLGGFAQFCNSCLLWIPSEIWSIIGMGFAMALVIMIVKIL